MLSRLLKDGALYTLPVLLTRGLNLLLLPIYTRILSPGEYGSLDLLLVFGSLVNLTLPLEVSQGMARFMSGAKTPELKSAYAATALRFTIACYALFLAAALAFAPFFSGVLLGRENLAPLFRAGALYIALNGVHSLLLSRLKWDLKSSRYSANSLVATLSASLCSVVLAWPIGQGLAGIVHGMIAGSAIGCALAVWQLRESPAARFQSSLLTEMLVYSTPLVASGVGVFLNTYVDRLMLKHFLNLESVGIYGMALRVAGVAGLATVGIQGALTPLIFSHHEKEETPRELARLFRLFAAAALLLVLGLGLFAPEIIRVFATPSFYDAAPLVSVLTLSLLLGKMYVFAPGLGLAKKSGIVLAINLAGGVLNLLLNLLLIPYLGLMGAALATLAGSVLMFAAYMGFSQKQYPAPHAWREVLAATATICLFLVVGQRLPAATPAAYGIKILLLTCAIGALTGTGLLSKNELSDALRRPFHGK